MRRLAVTLSGLLFATACSSDPILARDLNPTTTTTTTTTTTVPPATSSTTTTTTEAPGPDVSDVLRIAYDELIDAEALSYVSYADSRIDFAGTARQVQVGRWNLDGTGDLIISLAVSERGAELIEPAVPAILEFDAIRDGLEDGIEFRFLADSEAWIRNPISQTWTRSPVPTDSTEGQLADATDAAVYLDPLFSSIVEIVGDPVTDASGNTTFELILDADSIVPFIAPRISSGNLLEAGWSGVSEATTLGTVTLDPDGRLAGAFVDQTPWWQVGWEFLGMTEVVGDAAVGWTIAVEASTERFDITAPCDNPGTEFDEESGVDVLVCPA
jgi:hypothetical protein